MARTALEANTQQVAGPGAMSGGLEQSAVRSLVSRDEGPFFGVSCPTHAPLNSKFGAAAPRQTWLESCNLGVEPNGILPLGISA